MSKMTGKVFVGVGFSHENPQLLTVTEAMKSIAEAYNAGRHMTVQPSVRDAETLYISWIDREGNFLGANVRLLVEE